MPSIFDEDREKKKDFMANDDHFISYISDSEIKKLVRYCLIVEIKLFLDEHETK